MRTDILLCLLCLLVGSSYGLNCYECSAGTCEASMTEVACSTDYCLKVRLDGETTRNCAFDPPSKELEGCKGYGQTETCYCKGDLCNSAEKMSLGVLAFLLPALLLLR